MSDVIVEVVQVAYLVVVGAVAVAWFDREDIRS